MSATGFGLSWRNYPFSDQADTVEVYASLSSAGASVTVGTIDALRDPRLSQRCTLSASREDAGVVSLCLRWVRDGESSNPVALRVIGLMNYELATTGITGAVTWTVAVYGSGSGAVTNALTVVQRPSEDFPAHLWQVLSATIEDAYEVRILIEGTAGESGGSIDLTAGALWVGPLWRPPDGIEATWSQSIIDPGRMATSPGRQGYPRRRQRYRSFSGRAVHVPLAWAYGDPDDATLIDVQQLLYRVGTTEPVVLFARTLDAAGTLSPHLIHRLGVYGHMADTGRIEHLGGDLYQWDAIRVDELM